MRTDTSDHVPEHVRQFLRNVADSYEKLYTLVALFQHAGPLRLEELTARVGFSETVLLETLRLLRGADVVVHGPQAGQFMYAAGDSERDASVAWLAGRVDEPNVELVQLLNDTAMSRVRAALYVRFCAAEFREDDVLQ